MKTYRELIELFGNESEERSIAAFAEAIGITFAAAQSMHHRNSINPHYFPAIVVQTRRRGRSDITLDLLHGLKRGRDFVGNGRAASVSDAATAA